MIDNSSDWELVLRLIVATACGIIIGFQRELYKKPAGLRTHALICLGSALFTVVSVEGFGGPDWVDTSRVAAGVVTGIGFLGAGTIILREEKKRIEGLTTAASIWTIAAIGIACGAGLFLIAGAAVGLAALVLTIPKINEPRRRGKRKLIPPHKRLEK